MVLVVLIWALNNVLMKGALAGWVTPGAFNAVRFSLGAALLSALVLAVEGSLRVPGPLLPRVALLGIVGNGLNQVFFINGLALSTASNAGAWLGLAPVLVALIGAAAGLERVNLRMVLGAAISAAGIVTVLSAQAGGLSLMAGDLLLAGAVVTWSIYTVAALPLVRVASPLRVTAVAMIFAACGLVAVNFPALSAQDFRAVPVGSWLALLYAAAVSNGAGYALYVWSVRRIGAARAALFNNLGPVFTAAGARLILGERWGLQQWAGVALVIGGVVVARWEDLRQALLPARRSEQEAPGPGPQDLPALSERPPVRQRGAGMI